MIGADEFMGPAQALGYDFYTGVPCSFLTPFINRAITSNRLDYVGAASEGEAVAIAAGAWLAGRSTVVMCQNSGLGNAVNPLTSLNYPFRIPTMLITTWRGQPGLQDEPQHALMGQITSAMLSLMRIPQREFPRTTGEIEDALAAADRVMVDNSLPFAFVMQKESVRAEKLESAAGRRRPPGRRTDLRNGGDLPVRAAALERFLAVAPESAAVVATTGKCGRELFTLDDRAQHLYQVGSMGCASAMALGVALNSDRPVIALDGDGAALMKMGVFATIGGCAPSTMVHVLLDNGVHDSTGGQATMSAFVNFADVALACGYPLACTCDDLDGFETALKQAFAERGPSFIHLRIRPGSMPHLGRPRVQPHEVARRFRSFVTATGAADENGRSSGAQQ